MVREPWWPDDQALERALRDLGSELDYPALDVAASVRRRLEMSPAPLSMRRARRRPRRVVALLLAAMFAATGGVLAVSPAARAALSRWLALPGVLFVRQSAPPLTSPTPAPVGTALALGQRLTLSAARARLPYRILLPSLPGLTVPDEVYAGTPPHSGQVALIYRARPGLPRAPHTRVGLLLTEFRGSFSQPPVMVKFLQAGTTVQPVSVRGDAGYWMTGAAHLFLYDDDQGQPRTETIRLAGDTLLWTHDGLVLRLEALLPKAVALRVAASLH